MAKALARTSVRFMVGLLTVVEVCGVKSCGRSAILFGEIEGKDPIHSIWALQYLRMAKRTNGIVVAGLPVLLHRAAGKLVIFGATFIILGVVNKLNKIVDFVIRVFRQHLDLRRLQ